MDPKFAKGWSRKGGIHLFLKEFHKAMDCYQVVLDLDPANTDAKVSPPLTTPHHPSPPIAPHHPSPPLTTPHQANLEHVMMKIQEANQSGEADPERQKRAMADPEIQAILGDPQMRSILQVTPTQA
jgi:stress-induced-phosphoprotein 1